MPPVGYQLPNTIFRYVFAVSWPHQIALVILTVVTFLLEVAPLETQRRVVNDLVKERSFKLVITLCAAYAGVVLVQGMTKLVVNVYRGWVWENAIRDMCRHILAYLRIARVAALGPEAGRHARRGSRTDWRLCRQQLIRASSPGRDLDLGTRLYRSPRQTDGGGSIRSVPAAAGVRAVDTGGDKPPCRRARVVLRQLGVSTVDTRAASVGRDISDGKRIDRILKLNRGIKLKFSINFFMNLCNHFQIIADLLIGGWMVRSDQLEVGGVVVFISAVGRLNNDPWGDLVTYFRDLSVTQVKYGLVADRVNQLSEGWTALPIDRRTAFRVEA